MEALAENIGVECWAPSFLTKWWDLLDVSKKILLDLVYMHPGGVRTANDFFLSAILKHPSELLLIFDITEQSYRLGTFETFDQSDKKT